MSFNIALLTVLDKKENDVKNSGIVLEKKITELNHNILDKKSIKDNKDGIKEILQNWVKSNNINVIIITGGIELTGSGIVPMGLYQCAAMGKNLAGAIIIGFALMQCCPPALTTNLRFGITTTGNAAAPFPTAITAKLSTGIMANGNVLATDWPALTAEPVPFLLGMEITNIGSAPVIAVEPKSA